MTNASTNELSTEDASALLQLARSQAHDQLRATSNEPTETPCDARDAQTPRIAGRFGGAFVTFWDGRRLRGCVGSFVTTNDLAQTVEDVTRSSLADPRFKTDPITPDELAKLTIEVSVVFDLQPTDDPLSLVLGLHGIMIHVDEATGCFLPKVAAEHHWSPEQFLGECCKMKLRLAPDAWRSPGATVSLFTTRVLIEESPQVRKLQR